MPISLSLRHAATALAVGGFILLPAAAGGCGSREAPPGETGATSSSPPVGTGRSSSDGAASSDNATSATSSAAGTSGTSASSSGGSRLAGDAGHPDASSTVDAGASTDAADAGAGAGRGVDPLMGWSSWSFIRQKPTEATIKAQAQALHDSGLSAHGFIYVNIDDFYYLNPNTNVDANGRWVVDTSKFPDGMASLADFVHGLGMKFGMYVTPGIPVAAVTKNTPILGTQAHAADIAVTSKTEMNYNVSGSMYYIDYSNSGAQEFIDSWASLLASYGIDYLKIDGVGSFDIPDVQAWSTALKKTGRSIHLELSNTLAFANAATWASLSNGWRVSGDIECYCSSTSYPLTSWANASTRFALAAQWQPFSAPNARNDLDSLELGNGNNDGLTVDERQSVMSLWALAAAPLILGTDLTHLDATDTSLLTNDEVIAINQGGVAAKQVTGGTLQVWSAKEPDGTYAVGLFNLGSSSANVTAQWSSLGLSGAATVHDVWAHEDLGAFSGSYSATLASHASALLRIAP